MRIILLIILIVITFSCKKGKQKENIVMPTELTSDEKRKVNFPEHSEFIKTLPPKENVWIFLLAGQSNMAGRGFVEPRDTVSNNRILSIDKNNNWIHAQEPLHFYEPPLTGLDCGLSFGREMLKYVADSISIALIPCAVGGSEIQQWIGDSIHRNVKLYSNFKQKVELAKKQGTIKGILWHQGENDAHTNLIPSYEEKLSILFSKFRTDIQNDSLPIIIGELGSFYTPPEEQEKWDSINKIIHSFSNISPNTYVINTQDLSSKSDNVHFNASSQRTMGIRFAEKFNKITSNSKSQ